MLFDAPAEATESMPLLPEQPQHDEYYAPLLSLTNPQPQPLQKKVEERKPNPTQTVYQEDAVETMLAAAAADAVVKQHAAQPMLQMQAKSKQTVSFAERSAACFVGKLL